MPALARTRRVNISQGGYEPLRPIHGRPVEPTRTRRFTARLSDGTACVEAVDAPDFLQAALTYAETCAAHDTDAVNIAVTDAETGETHCFTVALG
jgi:hypothetical protein